MDLFGNAERLVELGVARRIDTGEITAEELLSAFLDLVADPQVRHTSARISRELRVRSGAGYAATLIEAELPRGAPGAAAPPGARP